MKRPDKAYKNLDFLTSREARTIRILAEYLEPEKRFKENNIKHTIVFFGSSRIDPDRQSKYDTKKYYEAAEELSYKLASWSKELAEKGDTFTLCCGGGPGIMEAVNHGANRAQVKSISLNISLPCPQPPNTYTTPELTFEFHYFFMRKLWFMYHSKSAVVFPGGYGTLDELFEALTLMQTHKLTKPDFSILLFDKKFWEKLIDFDLLAEYDLISPDDRMLFQYFESPQEGLEILKPRIRKIIEEF